MSVRTSRRFAVAIAAFAVAISACTNASDGGSAPPTATGSQTATTYQGTDFTINQPVNAPGVTDT